MKHTRIFTWLSAFTALFLLALLPVTSQAGTGKKADQALQVIKNYKMTGDYNKMAEKRVVRILMPYSRTFYFFDGATQKGISYDSVQRFEKFINKKNKKNRKKHLNIHTLIIPTARKDLLRKLAAGEGDIAIGNLTITEERKKIIDFADPLMSGVDEILVTGPKSPQVKNLFDLSGKEIHVRRSSSYYESLVNLNKVLQSAGKAPVKLIAADDNLEDEDLLEMVNAGLISMIIIDSHKGKFWAKILKKITIHPEIKVNSGGQIAWALRKNSPELKKIINDYTKTTKKGTLIGNIAFNQYLKNTSYIVNSHQAEDLKRFQAVVKIFKKYGKQYDFDFLLLAALAYQESRLDNNVKSGAGAVGIMQILPSTATDKNVNIKDFRKLESNIHAGTKYLDFMVNRYFSDGSVDHLNRELFAFAAYNAGPAKVTRMRKKAAKMGLNPNVWFRNVEVVAAKEIGRETVQYVSNIYKYYVAYTLLKDKIKID